ncbi:MAG: hypothetical protein AAGA44_10130 [Pseudomonadota bacterium]
MDEQERLARIIEDYIAKHQKQSEQYQRTILGFAYAGFFGLYQITKEFIDYSTLTWSAIGFTISATVFVLFEVLKTHHSSVASVAMAQSVSQLPQLTQQSVVRLIEGADAEEAKFHTRLNKYWPFVFYSTLVPGLLAVGLMLVSFGRYLASGAA